MAKIAYILLCHANAEAIAQQATALVNAGDCVAIHFDGAAPKSEFQKLKSLLSDMPNVAFAKRVKCGWGEWSLVQATLNGLQTAIDHFPDLTHCFLISGDCSPIKSAAYVHQSLDAENTDHIEHHDFWNAGWIQTGIKEERLHYRHFLNERKYPNLFYHLIKAQQILGLKRDVPKGFEMKIGSQWFCLRRSTVDAVLAFVKKRTDVVRFFKTVWIPDECFFQTVVSHLVPKEEIKNAPPTFLMFSDYGKPVTFYSDHMDFLTRQDRFFARKASTNAGPFRTKLLDLYQSETMPKIVKDDGKNIFGHLVQAGRHGRRFSGRIWDRGNSIGKGRTVYVIVSFDRRLGRALSSMVSHMTTLSSCGYIFEEDDAEILDLGGLQSNVEKRGRHRRAFLRTVFDATNSERLTICVTPSAKYVIDDIYHDACETRVLLIESDENSEIRHELRKKLGEDATYSDFESDQIARAMKMEIAEKNDEIGSAGYHDFFHITRNAKSEKQVAVLAEFLEVSQKKAAPLLAALKTK
ncbi:hypothetical protein BFP76_14090 [Amylibacter kogurei]|uniref:Peptide O-xylosyltransferase n=1 Tax=Paramylibacter kogurei TaxID=1889778 RepID=A0A2G5K9H0_9RHOB|nr:DUF5928 domain-containing protein [Amylibacter kogurei]PIB26085.1 hypothetical protein BFP76_14090 [Amylibacter kogurei]